jgi:hypothetical protein
LAIAEGSLDVEDIAAHLTPRGTAPRH